MSSARYDQLQVNVKEVEAYSQASLVKAKAIITTLTTKIAKMDDQNAIAEVKKAHDELTVIKRDLNSFKEKLLAGLPVSLISSSEIMRDISYNQQLIDQRLTALYWIMRGNNLADKLDQGKANLNEINVKRDWDFEKIRSKDAWSSKLHHTRISAEEGGSILNTLLSRVSTRVKASVESVEDAAMLREIGRLHAKEEEEKKAKIEKEAREKAVAASRTTPAGIAAKAAAGLAQDQIAIGAIKGCATKIDTILNSTGFQANKKVGILGKRAVDKKADEIRRLCARARLTIENSSNIGRALLELSQVAALLNEPSKSFFGKKDLPYKAAVFDALHALQQALPEKHKSKLTDVASHQPALPPVKRA